MDVPTLLIAARDRAVLTQAQLAAAAGTSRAAVSEYENGRRSPTVATLDRLLAAAGLQLRVELEPLLADLDERVDAVTRECPEWSARERERLEDVVQVLEGEHDYVRDRGPEEEPERGVGRVVWGFDGETALRMHGFGFAVDLPGIAVQLDDVSRTLFSRRMVRGADGTAVPWFVVTVAQAETCLAGVAYGPFGFVRVRLLEAPPQVVRVEVGPGLVVPVLTVEAVAQGRRDLAEVMERVRARSLGA